MQGPRGVTRRSWQRRGEHLVLRGHPRGLEKIPRKKVELRARHAAVHCTLPAGMQERRTTP